MGGGEAGEGMCLPQRSSRMSGIAGHPCLAASLPHCPTASPPAGRVPWAACRGRRAVGRVPRLIGPALIRGGLPIQRFYVGSGQRTRGLDGFGGR
jgi:hypothetical protein